jgi:hypothetical protein
MASKAEQRSDAMKVLRNPEDHSKAEIARAKKVLADYDAIQKDGVAVTMTVGVLPKSKKKMMKENKTKMMRGGMANGKPHMYLSEGALVVDKLPNAGTKALAKTAKGRKALRNMKLI